MTSARTFPIGACGAWLVSALPFVLPEPWFEGVSRVAWSALPWIAWASLPRARGDAAPVSSALVALALALPVLATAAWIDRAHGADPLALALVLAGAVVVAAAWGLAAQVAASARARKAHAAAWCVFVLGIPLLSAALVLGGASTFGPAPAPLAWLARASPLAWACGWLDASALAQVRLALAPLASIAVALAVAALVSALARGGEPESPDGGGAAGDTELASAREPTGARGVAGLEAHERARRGGGSGLLLVAACVAGAAPARALAPQNRAVFADVEIHGPASTVVLDAGAAGVTRITGALRAGETRRISVPVPLAHEGARSAPLVRLEGAEGDLAGDGHARFLGWRGGVSPLADLAPGVRARPLPAVSALEVAVSRAVPLVLLAAFLVVLTARRRPALAVAVAVLAAACTWPLVRPAAREHDPRVVVLDGEAGAAAWRRVDAAVDSIAVPEDVDEFELRTDPPSAAVTWTVPLASDAPWSARATGARLFVLSATTWAEDAWTPVRNGVFDLEAAWSRTDGAWAARGPVAFGAPLPPPLEGAQTPSMPPGWLVAGLPQGVEVRLGRLAAGTPDRPGPVAAGARGAGPRAVVWIRQTGP